MDTNIPILTKVWIRCHVNTFSSNQWCVCINMPLLLIIIHYHVILNPPPWAFWFVLSAGRAAAGRTWRAAAGTAATPGDEWWRWQTARCSSCGQTQMQINAICSWTVPILMQQDKIVSLACLYVCFILCDPFHSSVLSFSYFYPSFLTLYFQINPVIAASDSCFQFVYVQCVCSWQINHKYTHR